MTPLACPRHGDGRAMRMTRRARLGAAALFAALGVGCGGSTDPVPATPPTLDPGDHALTLGYQGEVRRILVRVPPGDIPPGGHPLLVAFHGGGGSPESFKSSSGLDAQGDVEGYVVVHPGGTGSTPNALTWNGGPDCCGYARDEDVDDVGFVLRMLDEVMDRHPLNLDAVFLTGHSNGAMMSYRLAAEEPDRWAGVIGVGAAMQAEWIPPGGAVPLQHIHSVDDPRAFYDGGVRDDRTHTPVDSMLAAWRAANGCGASPDTIQSRDGVGPDIGHTAVLLRWSCAGAPLEHWKLTGAGHAWPGNRISPAREAVVGPSTEVLSAPEEIFAFIRALRR